jgi:5-methylcytosine-specific restriction endonuclease McrBC GTP-binding regulatory subunit McrB
MKNKNGKMTLEKLAKFINKNTDQKFENFAAIIKNSFDDIDKRFDKVEANMDHRFDEVSSRLTSVERRLWDVELMS